MPGFGRIESTLEQVELCVTAIPLAVLGHRITIFARQAQRTSTNRFAQVESSNLPQIIQKRTHLIQSTGCFAFQDRTYHANDTEAHALSRVTPFSLIQEH